MCSTRLAEREEITSREVAMAHTSTDSGPSRSFVPPRKEESKNDGGSVELECREKIDAINEEGFESSDDEGLGNHFPQQRFSPAPQRSLTPDFGTLRQSPVLLMARRSKTPDENQRKGRVGRYVPNEMSCVLPKPTQGDAHNSGYKHGADSEAVVSTFVKPKLPTTKSSSPGLTISGHFQPTGNVFKPNIPSRNRATTKQVKLLARPASQVTSANEHAFGAHPHSDLGVQPQRDHGETPKTEAPVVHLRSTGAAVSSFSSNLPANLASSGAGGGGFIAGAITSKPELSPLPSSAQNQAALAYYGKNTGGRPPPRGVRTLQTIAPLVTAYQTVPKPAALSGSVNSNPVSPSLLQLPVQPYAHGSLASPVHASSSASTPSVNYPMNASSHDSVRPRSASPYGALQSFSVAGGGQVSGPPSDSVNPSQATPAHEVGSFRALADGRDLARESNKTILKRFLPDGMEE